MNEQRGQDSELKDRELLDRELEDREFYEMKHKIDTVLSAEEITVSEDLISRTLRAVQEATEQAIAEQTVTEQETTAYTATEQLADVQKTIEQQAAEGVRNKNHLRWKHYITYGLATAAGISLVCVSLSLLRGTFGLGTKNMNAESTQSVVADGMVNQNMSSMMPGFEEGDGKLQETLNEVDQMNPSTDQATSNTDQSDSSVNQWTSADTDVTNDTASETVSGSNDKDGLEQNASSKIVFDVAPDFVYSCGTEYGYTYLFYAYRASLKWNGQLVRVDLEQNAFELVTTIELDDEPQDVEFKDGMLRILINDEWVLFEE